MSNVFGVPVDIGSQVVYFRPIECGSKGDEKRRRMEECYKLYSEVADSNDKSDEDISTARALINDAMVEFFVSLLVQNYGDEARNIAQDIPSGWFSDIVSVATLGRLPENFTKVGRPTQQK